MNAMRKNALLTPDLLEKAVRMVLSAIKTAVNEGVANKLAGTFTVLDPDTGDILYTYDIADYDKKTDKYRQISAAKAMVSCRTGLPSRVVQQSAPYLYNVGDTV